MNEELLIEQEFNNVWNFVLSNKNAVSNQISPKAFVLGGQPGSGKSYLISKVCEELNDNVIVINGDDFRKFHPEYNMLQKVHGKDCVKYTAIFSGKMIEAILNKAIQERYNIVIEGTFRTEETPKKTLKLLKDNNYQTNVYIKTCHKNISWKNCLERYNKTLIHSPNEARYTNKDHHDLVVKNLAKNVLKVFKSGLVNNMKIYERENLIFDSLKTKTFKIDLMKNVLNKSIKTPYRY